MGDVDRFDVDRRVREPGEEPVGVTRERPYGGVVGGPSDRGTHADREQAAERGEAAPRAIGAFDTPDGGDDFGGNAIAPFDGVECPPLAAEGGAALFFNLRVGWKKITRGGKSQTKDTNTLA